MLHHLAEGKAVIQQHMINCFNFMQCVDFAVFRPYFHCILGCVGVLWGGGGVSLQLHYLRSHLLVDHLQLALLLHLKQFVINFCAGAHLLAFD